MAAISSSTPVVPCYIRPPKAVKPGEHHITRADIQPTIGRDKEVAASQKCWVYSPETITTVPGSCEVGHPHGYILSQPGEKHLRYEKVYVHPHTITKDGKPTFVAEVFRKEEGRTLRQSAIFTYHSPESDQTCRSLAHRCDETARLKVLNEAGCSLFVPVQKLVLEYMGGHPLVWIIPQPVISQWTRRVLGALEEANLGANPEMLKMLNRSCSFKHASLISREPVHQLSLPSREPLEKVIGVCKTYQPYNVHIEWKVITMFPITFSNPLKVHKYDD